MIRFKHFINEASNINNSIPSVPEVVHGTHAKAIDNQIPSVPEVVHGTHAHTLPRLPKPVPRPVKEVFGFSSGQQSQAPSTDEEKIRANQRYNDFLRTPENAHLHPNNPNLDGYSHIIELESKLQDRHPITGASTREMEHIKTYTASSKNINRGLIDNYKNGVSGPKQAHRQMYDAIMNALSRHSFPAMKLFSGIKFNPSKLGQQTEDQNHYLVHVPAFTSSSIDKHVANGFADGGDSDDVQQNIRHMLRIHVPEGHPGFYIGNDGAKSENNFEHEALLPAGMTLKIVKNPQVFHHSSFGDQMGRLLVWTAHIVPHGENPDTWQPPQQGA